jgi:hypothetical protein
MEMIERESGHIHSTGYDSDTQVLRVKFVGGAVHDYHDVSQSAADLFHGADSIGSHFMKNIRDSYDMKRVNAAPRKK